MRRACRVTLKFATAKKRNAICLLLEAYRAAVNFYIRSLWNARGRLDKDTLARLKRTRLSERYKSQALKQALEIIVATKKSAKALGVACSMPVFRGSAILDSKFVSVEQGHGSFDLIVRLSTLRKSKRIAIPTRRTAVLSKWESKPDASIVQGCAISERGLVLWVAMPDGEPRTEGRALGVDIGINKLIADSDGTLYGTEFKRLMQKVRSKKRGSKACRRARAERDQYIDRVVKQLPWAELSTIGVEDLKNVKKGKSKKRSKAFRKAVAPWTYRQVLTRIGQKAQENRVHLVAVPPQYTSRTCPKCGVESKGNRKGEKFKCVSCGHSDDSDVVGAQNVLARTLLLDGSLESPSCKKALK